MTTPDVPGLWRQADRAQAEAQDRYPAMGCCSGCNDCCKHHGSPITYASEWELIQPWLEAHPETLAGIRARYHELKRGLRARLQQPETPSLTEALFELPCPCIEATAQGERCAIYPVRPLTCRSFGNTLLAAAPESGDAIYTCNPEKTRWERELPMLGEIALPLRSSLFATLEADDSHRSLLSYLERYLARGPEEA
ncbi:MAG: YkgJ family cysteine cluster protein [Candidatus Sericytochromatia bacterium]